MRSRALLLIAISLIIVAPLRVFGTEDICADVSTIFARGSGQNSGTTINDGIFHDSGVTDGEAQSIAFFNEIDKRLSGVSTEYVSLHNFEGRYNQYGYEAVDVVDGFTSKPNHRTDVYNRYYESVADGAEELAWFLEDRLTSCPFQTVILGGYSQGAHVVGDAMFKIKPNFRPRIAYVALFGDPKFNPRTSMIPPTTAPWVRGNVSSLQTGVLLARKNYLPDEIALKASWCDIDDPICANYSLANTPVGVIYEQFINKTHQEVYQNRWIPQAANEIAMLLKGRNAALAGKVQVTPWINKNDNLYKTDLAIVLDVSYSMRLTVENIKRQLDGFTASLFNSYWDTRIALVGFSDNDYRSPYTTRVLLDFTYSKEAIKTKLQEIWQPSGAGGDGPEAQIAALMTAMDNLTWRKDAQKKILVITDNAPKNPDPVYGAWKQEEIIKKALEMDPVTISYLSVPLTDGQMLASEYANIFATGTNGAVVSGTRSYARAEVLQALAVMNTQPAAKISGPTKGYVGEGLALSGGESYDPDSYITSYSWDCNNDGIWEVTDSAQPTFECLYAAPYAGFVVLQVTSADGDSAKATIEVVVAERSEPAPATPEAPVASYTRGDQDVTVSWSNNYTQDVTVRIASANGDVIGIVNQQSNFTISPAPESAFTITLDAGNAAGWSEKTQLTIAEVPPLPEPTPTPTPANESDQSDNIYENDKNIPAPTPTPTAAIINQITATSQSIAVSQATPLPLTSVAGLKDDSANDVQANNTADNTFVTSEKSGLDTFLIVFGLLILGLGMAAITRKPK